MAFVNEKTIHHLCSVAYYLDSVSPAAKNITRHLREKCTLGKDEYGHNLRLPRHLFGHKTLCPKCMTPWSKGLYKLKVKSLKFLNNSRKASLKRLLAKNESDLNRFQSSFAERLKCNGRNLIILTCLECNKVSKISVPKSNSSFDQNGKQKSVSSSPQQLNEVKKKRKKKKKDSLCGLKKSAVAQVKGIRDESSNSNKPSRDLIGMKPNLNAKFDSKPDVTSLETRNEKLKKVLCGASPFERSNSSSSLERNCESRNTSKCCGNDVENLKLKCHNKGLPLNKTLQSNIIPNIVSNLSTSSNKKMSDFIPPDVKESREMSPDSLRLSEFMECETSSKDNSVIVKKSTCYPDIGNNNSEGYLSSTSEIKFDSVKPGNKSSKLTKFNLFSQPSIIKIQNNHKNDIHSDKTNSINNSYSLGKNPKGKKIFNDKGKTKRANSNNSSLSVNSKKQKKMKNKSKSKTSFLKKDYGVFENTNCQNSLCVKDLLSLT